MKVIKIIRGGWVHYSSEYEEHNLPEIKKFLKGEEFGWIINGGGQKRKPSKWARLVSVAVVQEDEVLVVNAGEYLVKTDLGFTSLTEEELNELST